jgi:RNA polymerase sigma factor (sigma-70 family)
MDIELVKKAILGNPEALALLIDKYKDIAYNLALSIVKDKEYAKDITQDSFLKVLENISVFRNESKFSTWLYRIVYNQSIQFVQKKSKSILIDNEIVMTKEYSGETAIIDDKYSVLYEAISKLDDNERNLIVLFYLAEKSIKEIKTITGLSVSNIKVTLHRIRKKLFEKLKNKL